MYLVTNFDEKNEIHRFKNGFREFNPGMFNKKINNTKNTKKRIIVL